MANGIAVAPIAAGNANKNLSLMQTAKANLEEKMTEENQNKITGAPATDKVSLSKEATVITKAETDRPVEAAPKANLTDNVSANVSDNGKATGKVEDAPKAVVAPKTEEAPKDIATVLNERRQHRAEMIARRKAARSEIRGLRKRFSIARKEMRVVSHDLKHMGADEKAVKKTLIEASQGLREKAVEKNQQARADVRSKKISRREYMAIRLRSATERMEGIVSALKGHRDQLNKSLAAKHADVEAPKADLTENVSANLTESEAAKTAEKGAEKVETEAPKADLTENVSANINGDGKATGKVDAEATEISEKAAAEAKEITEKAVDKVKEINQKADGKVKELNQKAVAEAKEITEKAAAEVKELNQKAGDDDDDDVADKIKEINEEAAAKAKEITEKAAAEAKEIAEKAAAEAKEISEKTVVEVMEKVENGNSGQGNGVNANILKTLEDIESSLNALTGKGKGKGSFFSQLAKLSAKINKLEEMFKAAFAPKAKVTAQMALLKGSIDSLLPDKRKAGTGFIVQQNRFGYGVTTTGLGGAALHMRDKSDGNRSGFMIGSAGGIGMGQFTQRAQDANNPSALSTMMGGLRKIGPASGSKLSVMV